MKTGIVACPLVYLFTSTLKVLKNENTIVMFANSLNPDMADNTEPVHLIQHCLLSGL